MKQRTCLFQYDSWLVNVVIDFIIFFNKRANTCPRAAPPGKGQGGAAAPPAPVVPAPLSGIPQRLSEKR